MDAEAVPLAFDRSKGEGGGLELATGFETALLTPNRPEFHRLACRALEEGDGNCKSATGTSAASDHGGLCMPRGSPEEPPLLHKVAAVAAALKGPTVLLKGAADLIVTPRPEGGENWTVVRVPSGARRTGGQGDLLCGCVAAFLCWARKSPTLATGPDTNAIRIATAGGCSLIRRASFLAYQKFGRAVSPVNVLDEVGAAFVSLFGAAQT
eukprot:GHVU01138624.1.p1 GENE.GHVU01138624.1~~GHVU01138624.1.p1  ORF type:complete len:210 (+),score=27.42 GHVU01138624.1:735-1364(+)